MQAILLNPDYDFSQAYYLITGVAGTPPSRGTIGDVVWGSWLIDYDLGHRWAPEEGEPGAPVFMPRKGYEEYRVHQLNPELVAWGVHLSSDVKLKDSKEAQTYRMRYPEETAQAFPSVKVGTHMTGDTFFHGPGLSAEALRASKYLGQALWRRWSGYHRRSRAETKMHCVKLLGQRLMARDFDR